MLRGVSLVFGALVWLTASAGSLHAASRTGESVVRNITYTQPGRPSLMMDVYQPVKVSAKSALPVIILFNSRASQRNMDFYIHWARTAAAHGFVAINPDADADHLEEDFDQLLAWLASPEHAAQFHIDAAQVAVYAGSSNVSRAFPLVEDARRTSVKAAVMYYGIADVPQFRADLPVLYVRAGLDRPDMNRRVADLAATALRQNIPITVLNHAGGHHAFEMTDDDDATRAVLEQTFEFLHSVLTPQYQAALAHHVEESSAAGAVLGGDAPRAVELYGRLVSQRPEDPHLLLSYGEVLITAGRYKDARRQFDHLRPMHAVGPRDLGVPAATACALDGDAEAAIDWLKSIPKEFLPRRLLDDQAFAPLRSRADFQALFQ